MGSNGPIDTWDINPFDVGPIYPFAGSEPLMFVACAAACLGFLVWKFRMERDKYEVKARELRDTHKLRALLDEDNATDAARVLPN